MTVIPLRLRVPLELRTRDQRMMEAALGRSLPPHRVPARTTLQVVDLFSSGAYALLPDGQHVIVSIETVRKHGYLPRSSRAAVSHPRSDA